MAHLLSTRYNAVQCYRSNVSALSQQYFALSFLINQLSSIDPNIDMVNDVCVCAYIFVFVFFSNRPVSDNRASLLRSSAPPKKTSSESQRDSLSRLWKNQVIMAMRLVPQIPSIAVRCASPDLSLR